MNKARGLVFCMTVLLLHGLRAIAASQPEAVVFVKQLSVHNKAPFRVDVYQKIPSSAFRWEKLRTIAVGAQAWIETTHITGEQDKLVFVRTPMSQELETAQVFCCSVADFGGKACCLYIDKQHGLRAVPVTAEDLGFIDFVHSWDSQVERRAVSNRLSHQAQQHAIGTFVP